MTTPTAAQIARLRADVAADATTLSDAEAADLYAEAAARYAGDAPQHAYVRVLALQRLLAQAALVTSYTQGPTVEQVGDVNKNLRELLEIWRDNLAGAVAADAASQTVVDAASSVRVDTVAYW